MQCKLLAQVLFALLLPWPKKPSTYIYAREKAFCRRKVLKSSARTGNKACLVPHYSITAPPQIQVCDSAINCCTDSVWFFRCCTIFGSIICISICFDGKKREIGDKNLAKCRKGSIRQLVGYESFFGRTLLRTNAT